MKKIIICCLVMCLNTLRLFAQTDQAYLIRKDTINLRGMIYQASGKPATKVFIQSATQLDERHRGYDISSVTDSTGYFEIKGIRPVDTLYMEGYHLGGITYINNNSRYVVIYLPQEKITDWSSKPIARIKAVRKYPKVKSSFKIQVDGFIDKGGTEAEAQFKDDFTGFSNYIQQRMQYPQKAIDSNIEGTVQIGFDVERDGTPINFKVLKGIGYGCDEEVINTIKNSPRWKPEIIASRPAIAHETVSVEFKLTDK
jgi:TonB family protein